MIANELEPPQQASPVWANGMGIVSGRESATTAITRVVEILHSLCLIPPARMRACRRKQMKATRRGGTTIARPIVWAAAAALFATPGNAQTADKAAMDRQARAQWHDGTATSMQQTAQAETPTPGQGPVEATPAPSAATPWKGPFGGTWTATFTIANDYIYRGASYNQGYLTYQASATYETAQFSDKVPLTAYVGGWGSNVSFGNNDPTFAEIDVSAGFRLKALNEKLTFDLGYICYNFLGAPASLSYNYNEIGLIVGYDFGVAQLSGSVRYSPNFFANSGTAWYKWGQVVVPLSFINLDKKVSFKLFGTLGNQYIQRFVNYGISSDNYWDWQVGLGSSVWGFDVTLAYVDANLPGNNGVLIATLSKTF